MDAQKSKELRQRKAALVLAGIRQKEVAEKLGVTTAAVSHVLLGRSTSKRIVEAIDEMLKEAA